MNRANFIILCIVVPIFGIYLAYRSIPYYLYYRAVHGKFHHELYSLAHWEPRFLTPGATRGLGEVNIDDGLWREFHIGDVVVPLPAGHPLYNIIPLISIRPESPTPQMGIMFRNPNQREIAKLYFLKSGLWSDQLDAQGLFKLPLVRKVLTNKSPEEIWNDLFTKPIKGWDLNWSEMVYNLYLVHLRSTVLPPGLLDYGKLESAGMAFVEIPSRNKDYRTELVFTNDRGFLLSYLLISGRDGVADDVRARFLHNIKFRASEQGLAELIYREFKQLSFRSQIDQEGMLYLFSAWSHDVNNTDMLKEMIYFLERGQKNVEQLKNLHNYAFERYQKTFTTRAIGIDEDDAEVRLQRKIELEKIEEIKRLEEKSKAPPPPKELTPKEKMEQYLKQAREEKSKLPTRKREKLLVP